MIPYQLSEFDENVPKTHIGMYKFLTDKRNESVYMGENACQNVRKRTFKGVFKLFEKYGSPLIDDFWNYNVKVITEIGMNCFAENTAFAPLAHLVECFVYEKPVKTKRGTNSARYVSFAIRVQYLNAYLKSRLEGIPDELELPEKSRDLVLFGETRFKLGMEYVSTENNALIQRFKDWCRIRGVTFQTGMNIAVKKLMDDIPAEKLKDLSEYDLLTEFDAPLFARPKRMCQKTRITVQLVSSVYILTQKILARYNRDVDNLDKERIGFDSYVSNALNLMNRSMNLKYRDPLLYKKKAELEMLEEYHDYDGGE